MSGIQAMLLGSAGGFDPISNSTVAIPIITSNSAASFLCLIGTSGALLGVIKFPSAVDEVDQVTYQRYQDQLYVMPNGAGFNTTIYRFNLSNFTVSSFSTSNSTRVSRTFWTRISATECLQVDTLNSAYNVLDLSTGTVSTTSPYTGATAPTEFATSQGMTSFYDRTSSGLTNFGSRVYWAAGNTGPPTYQGEINVASLTGTSLGSRTILLSSAGNYSRTWGAVGTNATALLANEFMGFRKVLGGSNSETQWTLASDTVTSGGKTYQTFSEWNFPTCLNSSLRMYTGFRYNPPGGGAEFALGTFDFSASSGTQTPVFMFALPVVASTSDPVSSTIVQIEGSGEVAALYQDPTVSTNTLKLSIISGSTINSTTTITLPVLYSSQTTYRTSTASSELGVYDV